MHISRGIIFIVASIISITAFAQKQAWGNLLVTLPEGWSSKQKDGTYQLSNYNLKGEELISISLFAGRPFTGKPDTLFAFAWRNHITEPPDVKETPRWRRFYTNDGLLVQQGFIENPDKENPLYRQLNVYVLDSTYQACLIETTSAKEFRQVQAEWQDRLLGVTKIQEKKKK